MDKIYSRNRRIYLPKFRINKGTYNSYNNGNKWNKNRRRFFKTSFIIIVAILTAILISKAISPIIDKQCYNMAKVVATKVSNEQASAVMAKYKYDDICNITKDNNRKHFYD